MSAGTPRLLSIGRFQSPPGGSQSPYPIHDEQFVIELITHGPVRVGGQETFEPTGTVFAHRPGEYTVSQTPEGGTYSCNVFLFEGDLDAVAPEWPRYFLWEDLDGSAAFAEEMLQAFHSGSVFRSTVSDLVLSQLRFRLEQHRQRSPRKRVPPRVAAALSHLEKSYADPLGVDELARRVGLSASHLHARFKTHVGMTPHQYLIRIRMRVARRRLLTTRDPVKAIAADVGFANTENFCRAFKKFEGLTAAEYRRRYAVVG